MRVLVAEDHALLRLYYADVITDLGFTVLLADDGQEALDVLRSAAVDVLLTDLNMPRMTGYQLLQIVAGEFPRLVCIIASAYAPGTAAQEMDRLGERLAGYLQKPFPVEYLERLLVDVERRIGLGLPA